MIKNPLQRRKTQLSLFGAAAALLAASGVLAQTEEPAQMTGIGEWEESPVFTIGETINGYTPPGIPDGMGAWDRGDYVQILANHELRSGLGYPYTLANGTMLTGARVSSFLLDKDTREIVDGGPAYSVIYNRAGDEVTTFNPLDSSSAIGLNRLCSAGYVAAGQAGFVDDIFFTGEETGGGTEFVLDVANEALYAAPWLGVAAWESVALLEGSFNRTHVAILVGDDRGAAPLLLYVGEKQRGGDFLESNGLATGKLYVWVADSGETTPEQWNGTGSSRSGKFVEIDYYRPDLADNGDYDALGFATQEMQDALAEAAGAFEFSRPEDLHTNPANGRGKQVVLASTGRAQLFPSDTWGTTYIVNVKINKGRIKNDNITATLDVIYDGDDAGAGQFPHPDFGLRSPDNLVWADDGYIYLQEDRSTVARVPKDPAGCAVADDEADCLANAFGGASGEEASMWQMDPKTGMLKRIAQIDRTAVPTDQIDTDPLDLGDWETSGVIDVSNLFDADDDETLLFYNVQAHALRGGPIGIDSDDEPNADQVLPSDPEADVNNLVEGGQFAFLEAELDDDDDDDDDDDRGRGRDRDDDDDDDDD
jgi:hypothetical protein